MILTGEVAPWNSQPDVVSDGIIPFYMNIYLVLLLFIFIYRFLSSQVFVCLATGQ
jgi:hypothetical protein